jgi:hypothetical protein
VFRFRQLYTRNGERYFFPGKQLTEDEISAELLADTLSDIPEIADSDSECDSGSSVIANRKIKTVHPLPS